jgi:hypothetical protein
VSTEKTWLAVEFVFANGTTGPGHAVDVGEGWCDSIDPMGVRFWTRSDGSTRMPYNPVRLMRPIGFYAAASLDQKKHLTA